jgi:hypothetical protein
MKQATTEAMIAIIAGGDSCTPLVITTFPTGDVPAMKFECPPEEDGVGQLEAEEVRHHSKCRRFEHRLLHRGADDRVTRGVFFPFS